MTIATVLIREFPISRHHSEYYNWLHEEFKRRGIKFKATDRHPLWTLTSEEFMEDLLPAWRAIFDTEARVLMIEQTTT